MNIRSHGKAARDAAPLVSGAALVWMAREFLHHEIPADVAMEILAGIVYVAVWIRNWVKHG